MGSVIMQILRVENKFLFIEKHQQAKYVKKLFAILQRLYNATEFEESGISLANIQRIITRHGAKVWAETKNRLKNIVNNLIAKLL